MKNEEGAADVNLRLEASNFIRRANLFCPQANIIKGLSFCKKTWSSAIPHKTAKGFAPLQQFQDGRFSEKWDVGFGRNPLPFCVV